MNIVKSGLSALRCCRLHRIIALKPKRFQSSFSAEKPQPHVCIVGSGPSGFVVAQTLLKNHPTLKVDVYDKSSVPFGLVRYGVSPDHQDVKNCVHGYTRTAQSDRFSFFGNVDVGRNVSLRRLCEAYHAVVLCTGAQGETKLSVPGENYKNVLTSNQFVGWYNGAHEYQDLDFDLSGETAVIIGVGNVALDAARMLFKPMTEFKDTDITDEAYRKLSNSKINTVYIVGRRGPLQMACTRKELAEITDLQDVTTYIETEHFNEKVQSALKKKDLKRRKQQRLVTYLQKVAKSLDNVSVDTKKRFFVKFLRSPIEICSENGETVSSIKFRKQTLHGEDVYNQSVTSTNETDEIKCDLIISCIGYKNSPLDSEIIPFENGKIIQNNVRVDLEKGLYASGWCSRGPKGVLADSGNDSLVTGSTILSDLDKLLEAKRHCGGSEEIVELLKKKNVEFVNWDGWQRIDKHEVETGKVVGKIRQKILSPEEMLSVAFKES